MQSLVRMLNNPSQFAASVQQFSGKLMEGGTSRKMIWVCGVPPRPHRGTHEARSAAVAGACAAGSGALLGARKRSVAVRLGSGAARVRSKTNRRKSYLKKGKIIITNPLPATILDKHG